METSDQINEISAALAKAQGVIEAASKDRTNPAFKSKYATLASVWDACRESLSANGIAVIQAPGTDDSGAVTMTTTLAHSSGQWMRSDMACRPMKQDAQGMGSVITYLRRYALAAMVGVAPDDDDDGNAAAGHGQQMAPAKMPPRVKPSTHGEDPFAANPHMVPVMPDDANGGGDWKDWTHAKFPERINAAKTAEEVQAIVAANGAPLDVVKSSGPKTYERLRSMWEGRIEALTNGQAA